MNGVVSPLLRISCRLFNPAGPTKDRDFHNVVINYRATTVAAKATEKPSRILFVSRPPPRGEFKNRIMQKRTRTLAAVSPAEVGGIGSTVSVVLKEVTVVFVRDRARVERTALGIAGGQSKVVEAAQDEASPTTLPGELPKAKNFMLGEGQGLLRAYFPKAQEPGRRHPRDGRAKTVAAGRELAEHAEDETHGGVCARPVKGAVLQ
jgi:hypothetical protein